MRRVLTLVGVALTAMLVGCGDEGQAPTGGAARAAPGTEDGSRAAGSPFIGSLSVDPRDGTLMIGTGLGLYRWLAPEGQPTRVVGRLTTARGAGSVSANLELAHLAPGDLVASGHPEGSGLPEDLGLIRSADRGDTWQPVSELGNEDFHVLERSAGLLVALPAGETRIMTSTNGGRTFTERGIAPAPPTDLDIDPSDAGRWVIATDEGTFTSADGGETWRQRDVVTPAHMAWAAPTRLYRVVTGGAAEVSEDGGTTWQARGSAGNTPTTLATDARGRLYAGLPDGIVEHSLDGGRTWRLLVELP
jgi:photosystem II stability/assembly factor-like uncharacterized protein